jgi:hypothetical protein
MRASVIWLPIYPAPPVIRAAIWHHSEYRVATVVLSVGYLRNGRVVGGSSFHQMTGEELVSPVI